MNKKTKVVDKSDELLSKKRGRRIKVAIGRTGKSQKDFALDDLHTSKQHLSGIVTGKHNLTRDNAERIAAAAGVRVEWLLCDDDFMTTEEIEETARKAQEKAEWSAFDLSSKILALDNAFEKATFQKLDFEAACASVTISAEKRLLLRTEVQDYADYLIKKLIEEALKNGSDCEAKE